MTCPRNCHNHEEEEDAAHVDSVLGITRCVQCGQDLEGEVECPLCSMLETPPHEEGLFLPLWVEVTAGFLTSPLSLWWVWRSRRLRLAHKLVATLGAGAWLSFIALI